MRFLLTIMILTWSWLDCLGIQFDQYHSVSYINNYMKRVAQQYDHVTFHYLGKSSLQQPVYFLEITKRKDRKGPAIYINGTHHGNEKASTEAALGFIDYLSRKHQQLSINRLLEQYVFVVQPLVNPDGHRENSRLSQGIDPNRDYPSPFANNLPFQLNETKLVSKLMKTYSFTVSAALHSGMEAVLWPWGSSHLASVDAKIFKNMGRLIADAMNIRRYSQSYHDYKTTGEFIDYAYMNYGTYAFTLEVAPETTPDLQRLPHLVTRSVKGLLSLANNLQNIQHQSH